MVKTQSPKEERFARTAKTEAVVPVRTASATDESALCGLHLRRIRTSVNLSALSETFAACEKPSILGGNDAGTKAGRFSYWACDPVEVFEFRTGQADPFGKLRRKLNRYRLAPDCSASLPEGMFCGGWIGYFAYDLCGYIEPLPQRPTGESRMPLIRLCFYDRLICYDHAERVFLLIALQLPGDAETPAEKLDRLDNLLAESRNVRLQRPAPSDMENCDLSRVRCNMSREYYLKQVGRIKRYIFDGDVYQVNFSQRFECDYEARPIELYHWLNHYNPSAYAAYIDAGAFRIVSASPEMFVTIAKGAIRTMPIKGTKPRFRETAPAAREANRKNLKELIASPKERAELNMIIDLERNDLARICIPGTRSVVRTRTIEACPTVFHAVATVAGRLRQNVEFCDVIRAMFPGGSITGAPKIRSMEIIDKLEPTPRGLYTGSIGCIGLDQTVCLNIAIRTVIIADSKAFVQVGGGIVADSDPQAEWHETITKARALLAGISATQRCAEPRRQVQKPDSSYAE